MATFRDIRPRELEWDGDNPKEVMTSYTTIFPTCKIGFRIMNGTTDKLILVDFTGNKNYPIESVEAGKKKAQELYNEYCEQILENAFFEWGSITKN